MKLIKEGVAEITATEEKNVNMRKSVTLERNTALEVRKQPEEEKIKMDPLFLYGREKKLHERQVIPKTTTIKG